MDQTKIGSSFITIVADEEPGFMKIPKEFANLVWGDKVPYKKLVEIRDGDGLRFGRISRGNGELVTNEGWMMLIREHDLKYKDVVWLKALGPLKFEVLCFKDLAVPTKFVNDFDGPSLTGQMVKVNFGDRNWNVIMDGDSLLTDGWTKVVEESNADVIIKSKLADVVGSSHVKMRYKAVAGNDVGVLSKDHLKRNSKDEKGKGKVDANQVMKTKKEYKTKRTVCSRSKTFMQQ